MELEALIWFTGVVITVVWGASMVASWLTGKYEGMQIATPVMLVYAGFLFAKTSNGRKKDGE